MAKLTQDEILAYLEEATILELNDLVSAIEEKFGVVAAAAVAAAPAEEAKDEGPTEVTVTLTWINGKNNLGLKTNIAEISEDYNDRGVPDIDSTPNNQKEGEDDIDIAKVILSIATGSAKTYFVLTLGLLTVILLGIILIKRFVL